MRTTLLLAATCALVATAAGCSGRAGGLPGPGGGGLAVVPDTATVSYEVAGLRVIHRTLTANDLVAVNLYLLGGSRQLTPGTAGIESLLLQASAYGTEGYPGRETRLALGRTGSRIVLNATPDWTLFGFRGVREEFESTWSVFADRVMRPELDHASVEVVRARMLRAARGQANHPDSRIRVVADSIIFMDHPYANPPGGTENSLSRISVGAMRTYLEREMITSRMLLVVVGDISRAQVESAIQRTFGQLPQGDYTWTLPEPWTAARRNIVARPQALPTNYVLGYFAGPPADSPDYAAFQVATMLLSSFASSEIRHNGLSYAAYAPFVDRAASGGGVYVSTTRPDTALRIFNNAIEFLQNRAVDRSALQRSYRGFVTDYYGQNESNAGQADFLARYQLLQGDWRLSTRYLDDWRAVQGIHIRMAARRYMRNIQYVYVGNLARIPTREMEKY